MWVKSHLTLKGPSSLWGTNGISGIYLQAYKFVTFYEIFLEREEFRELHGDKKFS